MNTQKITYVLFGILVAFLLATFLLDVIHAHYPEMPDPSVGRIFERPIKFGPSVYLTANEYAPYRWLNWGMISCAALAILVNIVDYIRKSR